MSTWDGWKAMMPKEKKVIAQEEDEILPLTCSSSLVSLYGVLVIKFSEEVQPITEKLNASWFNESNMLLTLIPA